MGNQVEKEKTKLACSIGEKPVYSTQY